MNFARAHKVAVYLVAWCAYLALIMSGELSDIAVVVSIAGIIASWWWEPPRVRVERWTRLWSGLVRRSTSHRSAASITLPKRR